MDANTVKTVVHGLFYDVEDGDEVKVWNEFSSFIFNDELDFTYEIVAGLSPAEAYSIGVDLIRAINKQVVVNRTDIDSIQKDLLSVMALESNVYILGNDTKNNTIEVKGTKNNIYLFLKLLKYNSISEFIDIKSTAFDEYGMYNARVNYASVGYDWIKGKQLYEAELCYFAPDLDKFLGGVK